MNKAEVAEYLGISTRAVERYAAEGRLSVTYVRGKTGKQAVYNQAEVEALKAELLSPVKRAIVAPTSPDTKSSESVEALASIEYDRIQQLIGAVAAYGLPHQENKQLVPIEHKPLLTLSEAQALTGLSRQYLRLAISQQELEARIIGKSWRIKRVDLDRYINDL